MQDGNKFDQALKDKTCMPTAFREALIDSVDTLELCWLGAQAVFGGKAAPEHALALLPIVMQRLQPAGAPSAGRTPPTRTPARTDDA